MADVPSVVKYGRVTGRFVSYIADQGDAANVPDEIALSGDVVLTPLTEITRWPTAVPPRLAIAQQVIAPVVNGTLSSPSGPSESSTPDVYLIATDQSEGQPNVIQWRAHFRLSGVTTQPADIVFNVPADGVVDLAMIASVPPAPGTIVVVSHEDALAAAASADAAEQSAAAAAASAAAAPKWWEGTQAQYDAIPVKDPQTLYVITP